MLNYFNQHSFKINHDKTEFIVFGNNLKRQDTIQIGDQIIKEANEVE